jgi:hypothetical protein
VAGADDQGTAAGEPVAGNVGQRPGDQPGGPGLGLSRCRQAGRSQWCRAGPGSGGVDDGAGKKLSDLAVAVLDPEEERGLVAAEAAALVHALPADGDDTGADADPAP